MADPQHARPASTRVTPSNPYHPPTAPVGAAPAPPGASTSPGRAALRVIAWSILLFVAMGAAVIVPVLVLGAQVCLPGSFDCLLATWPRHAFLGCVIWLVYRLFLRRTRDRHLLHCLALFLVTQALLWALKIGANDWLLPGLHLAGAALALVTFRRSLKGAWR